MKGDALPIFAILMWLGIILTVTAAVVETRDRLRSVGTLLTLLLGATMITAALTMWAAS